MDCHLFCHNEVPTLLVMYSFAIAGLGFVRAKVRQWRRR